MGFIDWIKQTASNVGRFVRDKVISPISTGVSWVNQNVVQPAANVLRNVPGVGQVAALAGQAGNAAQNLGEMAAGKRKFDFQEALGAAKDINQGGRAVYDAIKKRA